MTSNSLLRDKILPIGTVVLAIIAIWYAAAVFLNTPFERDQAQRAGTTVSFSEILPRTMAQERPVLPAPHQVFAELWDTTVGKKITSKTQPGLPFLDHAVLDPARLPDGHRAWRGAGGRHRPLPDA
jgi:hypothetical protein